MKKTYMIAAGAVATTAALAGQASAAELQIDMKSYNGQGAYLAVYMTDAQGNFKGTLHVAGGKSKYYKHLKGWKRASGGAASHTGASAGSGRSLKVSFDLTQAMIDAGYQIHIDSSVEDQRDVQDDAVISLANGAPAVSGRGYVKSALVY